MKAIESIPDDDPPGSAERLMRGIDEGSSEGAEEPAMPRSREEGSMRAADTIASASEDETWTDNRSRLSAGEYSNRASNAPRWNISRR